MDDRVCSVWWDQIESLLHRRTRPDAAVCAFVHAAGVTGTPNDAAALAVLRAFRGDVNGRDGCGYTALVRAIVAGNVVAVNLLLEGDGVDVVTPVRGQPPAVWAVVTDDDDARCLKLLHRKRSVDINTRSDSGRGEVGRWACVRHCASFPTRCCTVKRG